jgi:imidazolonepropionase
VTSGGRETIAGRRGLRVTGIGRLWTPDGALADAVIDVRDGRVEWIGPRGRRPPAEPDEEFDAGGALATPGFVDAHTHPVYAGNRYAEVAARSAGAAYQQVAAAGGGIGSTVRSTRACPPDRLAAEVRERLRRWPAGGATTVEVKTGYHLERTGELADVGLLAGLDTAPGLPRLDVTFLGAHAVPDERSDAPDGYVADVCSWCPAARAAGARHVDVFCDAGYFTVGQAGSVLVAGRAAGLLPRLHADELARTGGSELAAELAAVSADHLLRITPADAAGLAAAGVVATVCPATALAMGVRPPVEELRAAGVTIGLGTDHNPGTSGLTSMAAVVGLAVHALGLPVGEALEAATAGGAAALRRRDRGRLRPGEWADLALWPAEHEGFFGWAFGDCRPLAVLRGEEWLLGGAGPAALPATGAPADRT